MNLGLLESFGQNYPEVFDGVLDSISIAVTCMFNKFGTLLAVGCNDGRIVIWDFPTRKIAKIITAHLHPVCSLSWSKNGKKILSGSTDNNVCVWDVCSGVKDEIYNFPSAILNVQFHPKNINMFLVCPLNHTVVLMEIKGNHKKLPFNENTDSMIVASFDHRGQHIFTGNAHSTVTVFTCPDLELKASFKISPGIIGIKNIEFSRKGQWFLLNCSDRIIRVYDIKNVFDEDVEWDKEPIQKLQDLVNRTTWKKCCFSGDGEYICAGSARQHAIYIWERSVGNLVKILHGSKRELLLDIIWHPFRTTITSISNGLVSVWTQHQIENWSAFAPDFKELDENIEYEERESEFDLEDEDKSLPDNMQDNDEDLEIDVENIEPIAAYYSSDEENLKDNLLFLPIDPDIDSEPETSPPTAASSSNYNTLDLNSYNTKEGTKKSQDKDKCEDDNDDLNTKENILDIDFPKGIKSDTESPESPSPTNISETIE